jgi:quinol monooxygenase YgiN
MTLLRRDLALAAAAAAMGDAAPTIASAASGKPGYQVISQITALPGKRDQLAAIMEKGSRGLAGCIAYVIAADQDDAEALWITELWTDRASHERSLRTEQVATAIARGRPLMKGFLRRVEIDPIGGFSGGFGRA